MAAIYGGNRKPSVIATAVMIERLGRAHFAREGARRRRNKGTKDEDQSKEGRKGKKEEREGNMKRRREENLARKMGTSMCIRIC